MSDRLKVSKKDIDQAVNHVMDVAFSADDAKVLTNKGLTSAPYRAKVYRKVAWDLLLLAAQMEAEATFDVG